MDNEEKTPEFRALTADASPRPKQSDRVEIGVKGDNQNGAVHEDWYEVSAHFIKALKPAYFTIGNLGSVLPPPNHRTVVTRRRRRNADESERLDKHSKKQWGS
ncbi:hypothetical protein Tcan_01902 [Toxocara canis]|uniref:Uncharacterized protein n=1 Tax=Toxocara canis TaxID=6265 RepID=A0A0B2VS88_TOXCA|nr:hypothetical protein Tcan_01902 [Toxocara canis]